MSLDGFLTFLALAVAIYALITPVAKLRIQLGFSFQLPLAGIALVTVLFFLFFDQFVQLCLSSDGDICDWLEFFEHGSFRPNQFAFVTVLVWMALAYALQKLNRPRTGSLSAISQLVDILIYEKRFSEVLELTEPYLPLINKAANRKLLLQQLHDSVAKKGTNGSFDIVAFLSANETKSRSVLKDRVDKLKRRLAAWLAHLIPAQRKPEQYANEIARVLFRSKDLRHFIAQMRPYFAISLLQVDTHGKHEFFEEFFTDLISDLGGILYEELEHNQNYSASEGYYLPEHNRLLHFLLSDAATAYDFRAYGPVGEYLLKLLERNEASVHIHRLNERPDKFFEERFKDPFLTGFFFLELVITTAAHQGIRSHMWLYYFPHFVTHLENIYDTNAVFVNTTDEFPTRSAALIYDSLDILGRLVALVRHLPENSPHLEFQHPQDQDNGNIPVSACVALGSCIATIMMSERIGDRFASYMHEVVVRDIRDLRKEGAEGHVRKYLIQCIVRGGQKSVNDHYGKRLAGFLTRTDQILRREVDDYETALKSAYPNVLP